MTNMAAAASGGGTCQTAVPGAARSQSLGGGGGKGWGSSPRRAQEHWLAAGSGQPGLSFGCHYSGEGLAAEGLWGRSGPAWGPIRRKGQTYGDGNAVCSGSPGCLWGSLR